MTRRRGKKRTNPLIYVALVAASLFAILPLLWGLSTSFKSESATLSDQGWIPAQFTFENYRLVLFESKIPLYLGNTLLVAGLTVIATIVIAIFGAYAAARFRFRGKTTSMFLILMTSMIPGIAILVPLYFLAVSLGLYDTYAVMVIIYTAWQIPTVIWMLKGFFESIPDSIEEAGRVDGASHWRVMVQLIFPLAVPGIAAAAVISFIYVWNDFLIASTMISTDDKRLVAVGLYNYLSQYGVVWGQLTAAVVVTIIPIILVFVLMERRIVAGLSAGATKG
ncbi:carbohydrate ABC transporter permease [Herbiconiux moechotypicola]|uniref:Carbohydrate ABC transporter permease n=1 Tax=Herbiconiux moechotypicola TaxID=637393 RepID=A0ABP5QL42_9MICO|nr:carbohydrate ABC transporter permease [Herbiconiux moechotypicola]MCS5731428.1 carbohydrate ABC transporter permease [Herbiconiux moechotypicola]